jgi:hypothetical protein
MSEPQMYAREETSLSLAWARAFLIMSTPPERELAPFLISIAGGPDWSPEEDDLRDSLDACLEEAAFQTVNKVAKSIFPHPLWNRARGDRHKLYADYLQNLPDYVAMESSRNRHGLYFARLIGYGINHKTGEEEEHLGNSRLQHDGNQLEFIINALKPKAQRMALQASIYDPVRDQTEARRPFPCLQHVTFVPDFVRKTLSLNAFYAMQLLFVKGYGNWLGLCRLGEFVASQAGLRFERLNCYAGIQKMTTDSRPQPGELLDRLTDLCKTCLRQASIRMVGAKG